MKNSKEEKLRKIVRKASLKKNVSESLTTSAGSGKKVRKNSTSSRRRADSLNPNEANKTFQADIPPGTEAAYPVGDPSGRGRKARITSRSGYRGSIQTSQGAAGGTPHGAYDFGVAIGTPIVAYADGNIAGTSRGGAGGNGIKIVHPGLNWTDGDNSGQVTTYYAHLSEFIKTSGPVKAGEIIGLSGNTGRSTGPHLHWSIRINGQSVKSNDGLYDQALSNSVVINTQEVEPRPDSQEPAVTESKTISKKSKFIIESKISLSYFAKSKSEISKKSKSIIESKISLSAFVREDSRLSELEKIIDSIVKKEIMKEGPLKTSVGKKIGGGSSASSNKSSESDSVDAESRSGNVARIAQAEVEKWDNRKEDDPDMKETLVQYARNLGLDDNFFVPESDGGEGNPWSAGFISAIMDAAGVSGFDSSASHRTYMQSAKRNRDAGNETGQIAYKPDEVEIQDGDVLCKPRGTGDGYENIGPMNHCDIYVGNRQAAGGNLSDTAKLTPAANVAMVIKNKIAESFGLSAAEILELESILR